LHCVKAHEIVAFLQQIKDDATDERKTGQGGSDIGGFGFGGIGSGAGGGDVGSKESAIVTVR